MSDVEGDNSPVVFEGQFLDRGIEHKVSMTGGYSVLKKVWTFKQFIKYYETVMNYIYIDKRKKKK